MHKTIYFYHSKESITNYKRKIELFLDGEILSKSFKFLDNKKKEEIHVGQELFLNAIRYWCYKVDKFSNYTFDLILINKFSEEEQHFNLDKTNLNRINNEILTITDVILGGILEGQYKKC